MNLWVSRPVANSLSWVWLTSMSLLKYLWSAGLRWPQLGQLSLFPHLPTGQPGLFSWERKLPRESKVFWSLGLERAHHHFCHIPLAKASQKASPDSGGRETDSISWGEELQRLIVKEERKCGAIITINLSQHWTPKNTLSALNSWINYVLCNLTLTNTIVGYTYACISIPSKNAIKWQ